MRFERFICLGIVLAAVIGGAVSVWAQEGWRINSLDSDLTVQPDGVLAVTESIAVDFGLLSKHGIYRDLPVTYQEENGSKSYTRITDITVIQDGTPAVVDTTSNGANLRIKIGDADRTISGKHDYVISYAVTGVLRAYEGFDELYWNVTGNEWEVPINEARATVTVPVPVLRAACYKGVYGSKEKCDDLTQAEHKVTVAALGLAAGEGLTVAVGWQSGAVPILTVAAPPTLADIIFAPVTLVTAGLVWLIGAGWLVRHWWKYGRDRYWARSVLPGVTSPGGDKNLAEKILPFGYRRPVSVEYESPNGLRPAEIGVLMDEKADTLDVSATIVDLAARGYLIITEISKKWLFGSVDYEFGRTDKGSADLLQYEHKLLEGLFDDGNKVKLSELKNKFYKDLEQVKDELYEEMVRKKLFAGRPDRVRALSFLLTAGLAVPGTVLVFLSLNSVGNIGWLQRLLLGAGIGLAAAAVVAALAAPFMPRKSGLGRELYERAKGYRLFVSGTEKYRARWLEDEGLFERVLPYAIVFGVTDKLAQAFREMGYQPQQPGWYHGAGVFNAAVFAANVDGFSKSLSSALASRPGGSGSGGGGFSGGGGGGGGGGSW
ncbi:MAG: DUF2207 domain-containing protein [Candidatus Andersenbacteria bacterium]|nr:DUF2207 domain-containing protein [bacterium]MDZ4225578.1 DUF2207 domain-containing protein [Candidatus Andersenbacteria bacterium]